MRNTQQKPEQTIPDWWNDSLYDFLKEMPLKGWVWEFMRRARLKKAYGIKVVEAMRANAGGLAVPEVSLPYYSKWHPKLYSLSGPICLPPSVTREDHKDWVTTQPFLIDGYEGADGFFQSDGPLQKNKLKVTIDLNRWDTAINRDFTTLLKELREEYGWPKQIYPRPGQWIDNRILEVWDLKELNVGNKQIQHLLHRTSVDSVKNAYRTVSEYIDKAKWKKLALYCDAQSGGIANLTLGPSSNS